MGINSFVLVRGYHIWDNILEEIDVNFPLEWRVSHSMKPMLVNALKSLNPQEKYSANFLITIKKLESSKNMAEIT